jgi:hypothetical protein
MATMQTILYWAMLLFRQIYTTWSTRRTLHWSCNKNWRWAMSTDLHWELQKNHKSSQPAEGLDNLALAMLINKLMVQIVLQLLLGCHGRGPTIATQTVVHWAMSRDLCWELMHTYSIQESTNLLGEAGPPRRWLAGLATLSPNPAPPAAISFVCAFAFS